MTAVPGQGSSPISGTAPRAATRWRPSQSGNPGGRPKGRSITAELRDLLENEHNGRRLAAIIAELILKGALQGRLDYLREVMDRTEGKPAAHATVQVNGGGSVVAAIYVPGPEIIGAEAHRKAVENAGRLAPPGTVVVSAEAFLGV